MEENEIIEEFEEDLLSDQENIDVPESTLLEDDEESEADSSAQFEEENIQDEETIENIITLEDLTTLFESSTFAVSQEVIDYSQDLAIIHQDLTLIFLVVGALLIYNVLNHIRLLFERLGM